jgi:Protein of unknown function (DUF4236)
MAFGFRKSFRLAPGLRLSLSKRGASLSAGPRGAKVSASTTGRRRRSLGWRGFSWRR